MGGDVLGFPCLYQTPAGSPDVTKPALGGLVESSGCFWSLLTLVRRLELGGLVAQRLDAGHYCCTAQCRAAADKHAVALSSR